MGMFDDIKEYLDKAPASKPTVGTLGSGGANKAANALRSRAYQLYASEKEAMGEQPEEYEMWVMKNKTKKGMLF